MSPGGKTVAIPRLALVVLMGPSAAVRSEFAKRWFPGGTIVAVDRCREMVADDATTDSATDEALALLETWVAARIKLGRLTVVDTPGIDPRFRARMIELARAYHAPAFLIVLDPSVESARGGTRAGARQRLRRGRSYRRFLKAKERVPEEGWNRIVTLKGRGSGVEVSIRPLRVECDVPPPYDLIGDIHGCHEELVELLEKLGYRKDDTCGYRHPEGRRVVFVGDLVDRGPASLEVLRVAMTMQRSGSALVTLGNHDNKLLNYLVGSRVRVDHGLELTVAELDRLDPGARRDVVRDITAWLRGLPPYLMLDEGRLVVAHAGLPEHLHGRLSRVVTAWAMYGAIRPVWEYDRRGGARDWPGSYRGKALVVYGHTPTPSVDARSNPVCVDQGCVFGGKLTALRYPERVVVQVDARATYYPDDAPDLDVVANGTHGGDQGESQVGQADTRNGDLTPASRADACNQRAAGAAGDVPGGPATASRPGRASGGTDSPRNSPQASRGDPDGLPGGVDTLPDLGTLLRKGELTTRWTGKVKIRSVSTALEALQKCDVDPRWLVYVPPPLLPSASSPRKAWVDHLEEVFHHYRDTGLGLVVEEMHLATRVIAVVARDEQISASKIGISGPGMIYDMLGRRPAGETLLGPVLHRLRATLETAGAFERLSARLLIIDAGMLPWNLGQQDILARQVVPAAGALMASRMRAAEALEAAMSRGLAVDTLLRTALEDKEAARRTLRLVEQHSRMVEGPDDIRLAPHQVVASDTRTFFDKDRRWQWEEIERWIACSDHLVASRRLDVNRRADEKAALDFWEELSAGGQGGVVVRTTTWFPMRRGRPLLPAVKVRGREALRLHLGPLYLSPAQIGRFKERPIHQRQGAAVRLWALAGEGVERFVRGGGFADYHPYALAVLAERAGGDRRRR